jgi:hypothetical protein
MSAPNLLDRDERTVAVENASYRWGFIVLVYALLIDVVYRAGVRHEAPWDLMAFVVVSGGLCSAYQAREKALGHRWGLKAALVACMAGVLAAIIAWSFCSWTH